MDLKALDNREVRPNMGNSCNDMEFLNTSVCNDSNVIG